jgi:DNA-binding XRE family transcriptional regulator
MPFVDVTEVIKNDEAKELDIAYKNDPKVKTAIDQFNAECKLRRELAEARKNKKITKTRIHELTGLTQQAINRIESNSDISPSLKNFIKYTNAIGYEIIIQPKKETMTVS